MDLTAQRRSPTAEAREASRISITWSDFSSAVRAATVSLVVAVSVLNPTFGLRQGAIVCALIAAWGLLDGAYRPNRVDALAVGFVLVCVASLMWASDPRVSGLSARNFAGAAAAFLAIRAASVGLRTCRLIAYGFIAGTVFAAIQLVVSGGLRYSFDERAERIGLDVARGASQNYLAYCFVGCLTALAIVWATQRPHLLGRIACAGALSLMWLGIVQTGTRGALVGLFLFVAWAGLQLKWPGCAFRSLLLSALGVQAAIVSGLFDGQLAALTGSRIRDTGTLNGRLELWPAARDLFRDHPFLGVGAGGFSRFSPLDAPAHNIVLDVGTGVGLIGLAIFAWLVYASLVQETRSVAAFPRALAVGGLVTATLGATSSGFWVESPALWSLFALVSCLKSIREVRVSKDAEFGATD